MDDEQIWEQLQLHTLPLARLLDLRLDELDILSSEVAAVSSKLTKPEELFEDEDDDEDDDEDEDEHEHDDDDDDEDENEEDDNVPARASRKRKRLDDDDSGDDAAFGQDEIDFFDAGEMERFVQDAEERQARKRARRSGHESDSDDDDDEDEDGDDDEDDENDDDDNDEAGGRDDEEDEDDDDEDDDEDEDGFDGAMLKYDDFFDPPKSKHQLELEKKKELIAELENANLAPKPWHLSGEVRGDRALVSSSTAHTARTYTCCFCMASVLGNSLLLLLQVSAKDRPAESLLEQAVFFEHATKAPPVITEAVTVNLENIIKRRIAEESWDDVIRKVEAEAKEFQPKKELDHEKSKASLAEIYEQQVCRHLSLARSLSRSLFLRVSPAQYMQQIEGVQAKNELQAKHLQIENMFRSLSAKLDALSNFHATPRKVPSTSVTHTLLAGARSLSHTQSHRSKYRTTPSPRSNPTSLPYRWRRRFQLPSVMHRFSPHKRFTHPSEPRRYAMIPVPALLFVWRQGSTVRLTRAHLPPNRPRAK